MVNAGLWPLAVYTVLVFILITLIVIISYYLGERHQERTTDDRYESGVAPAGPVKRNIDVGYYLVAVFFVIFDLEAVFIYSWAVSVRELGWPGYIEIVIFIFFLFAGLVYLWLVGALDATTWRQRADKIPVKE